MAENKNEILKEMPPPTLPLPRREKKTTLMINH